MNIVLIIIILIVGFFVVNKFVVDNKVNSAKANLGHLRVSEKFKAIIDTITEQDIFFHDYRVVNVSPIQDNLCSLSHSNVIILLTFFEEKIHLEWKYKFFQKEVIRKFSHPADNFTEPEQRRFASQACKEMHQAIREHQSGKGF